MKRIKLIAALVLFYGVVFLTSCSDMVATYSEESFMGVKIVTESELYDYAVGNDPVFNSEDAGLYFDGNPVPYYKNEYTYMLPVDLSNDSWDNGRLSSSKGGTLYFIEDESLAEGTKAETVAGNKEFRIVHIVNGEFSEYSIVFTGLPIMTIDMKEEPLDPNYPIGDEDEACVLTMFEPQSGETRSIYQSSDALVHQRGGSTLIGGYSKVGLRINLRQTDSNGVVDNNHLSFCGLRTEDDWILLPLYTEETKVREKFCIDTWGMFGLEENDYDMDNGTRMEYIEVIMNGEYWGMFGLVEPIDGKQLNLTDGDALFKIHSWTQPKAEVLRQLGNTVFYIDYSVAPAEQETMDVKYPKEDKVNQEVWDIMAKFMESVFESNPADISKNLGDWIKVENAVDHWLFTNFICCGDNTWKNLYISFKKDGDAYKIHLTPWDFDLSFGLSWSSSAYLHWRI